MNTPSTLSTCVQRGVSLCLAAVVTLSLLGGIDHLAQHPVADAAWAAQTSLSTPRG